MNSYPSEINTQFVFNDAQIAQNWRRYFLQRFGLASDIAKPVYINILAANQDRPQLVSLLVGCGTHDDADWNYISCHDRRPKSAEDYHGDRPCIPPKALLAMKLGPKRKTKKTWWNK